MSDDNFYAADNSGTTQEAGEKIAEGGIGIRAASFSDVSPMIDTWAVTTGLSVQFNHPELVVTGLADIGPKLVGHIAALVAEGLVLTADGTVFDLGTNQDGVPVQYRLREVDPSNIPWLYGDWLGLLPTTPTVYQILTTAPGGYFMDDPACPPHFAEKAHPLHRPGYTEHWDAMARKRAVEDGDAIAMLHALVARMRAAMRSDD